MQGKGRVQTSSPFSAADRLAGIVQDLDREAEAAHLDLAAPDRAGRVAEHEAGDDVGAARDRGQLHVGLDLVVDVVEALRVPAASRSRASARSGREIVGLAPAATPAFLQASMYLALVPKTVTRSARGHVPEHVAGSGWKGEPSNRISVSSTARPPTSQFHIIQPQVVK